MFFWRNNCNRCIRLSWNNYTWNTHWYCYFWHWNHRSIRNGLCTSWRKICTCGVIKCCFWGNRCSITITRRTSNFITCFSKSFCSRTKYISFIDLPNWVFMNDIICDSCSRLRICLKSLSKRLSSRRTCNIF